MINRKRFIVVCATATLLSVMFFFVLCMSTGCSKENNDNVSSGKTTAEINFNKGKKLYNEHRYADAIEYLKKAAEQGHHDAQTLLGDYYFEKRNGLDYSEALEWYEKASKTGEHTKETGQRIFMCFFLQEANKGDRIAQFYVFCAYEDGIYVKQDKEEAKKWLKKAADSGHPDAKSILKTRRMLGQE